MPTDTSVADRAQELSVLAPAELVKLVLKYEYPTLTSADADSIPTTAAHHFASVGHKRSLPASAASPASATHSPATVNGAKRQHTCLHCGSHVAVTPSSSTAFQALAPPATSEHQQAQPSAHPPASSDDSNASGVKRGTKKAAKPFDFYSYRQRFIALRVAYLGQEYHGLALQNHAEYNQPLPDAAPDSSQLSDAHFRHPLLAQLGLRTVERELFSALVKSRLLTDHRAVANNFNRCGRTDKGVSAFGQVMALQVRSAYKWTDKLEPEQEVGMVSYEEVQQRRAAAAADARSFTVAAVVANNENHSTECQSITAPTASDHSQHPPRLELDYAKILNKLLPADIRVLHWQPVPLTFNSRHDCRMRTYRYLLYQDDLDLQLLRNNAQQLMGSHDFRHYCKIDAVNNSHFKRYMHRVHVHAADTDMTHTPNEQQMQAQTSQPSFSDSTIGLLPPLPSCDRLVGFEITGNAFLYHQVRCMTAVLCAASTPDNIQRHRERSDLVQWLLDPPGSAEEAKASDKPLAAPIYEMASEEPLVLWDCSYEGDYITYNPVEQQLRDQSRLSNGSAATVSAPSAASVLANLEQVYSNFHQLWRSAHIRAATLRQYLEEVARMISAYTQESSADINERLRGQQLDSHEHRSGRRYVPFGSRKRRSTFEQLTGQLRGKDAERRAAVEQESQRWRPAKVAHIQALKQAQAGAQAAAQPQSPFRSS